MKTAEAPAPEFRRVLVPHSGRPSCPFANLSEHTGGPWGEGLTVREWPFAGCIHSSLNVWRSLLDAGESIHHSLFVGIRCDKDCSRGRTRNDHSHTAAQDKFDRDS